MPVLRQRLLDTTSVIIQGTIQTPKLLDIAEEYTDVDAWRNQLISELEQSLSAGKSNLDELAREYNISKAEVDRVLQVNSVTHATVVVPELAVYEGAHLSSMDRLIQYARIDIALTRSQELLCTAECDSCQTLRGMIMQEMQSETCYFDILQSVCPTLFEEDLVGISVADIHPNLEAELLYAMTQNKQKQDHFIMRLVSSNPRSHMQRLWQSQIYFKIIWYV